MGKCIGSPKNDGDESEAAIRGCKPVEGVITLSNQRWGMDFVSISLAEGRTFRALAIVDHYTLQCLALEVNLNLLCISITYSPDGRCKIGTLKASTAKVCDECFNTHWFTSLRQARSIIEYWRRDYKQVRPHNALGYATPNEFAQTSSACFAVETFDNAAAKPGQNNPRARCARDCGFRRR